MTSIVNELRPNLMASRRPHRYTLCVCLCMCVCDGSFLLALYLAALNLPTSADDYFTPSFPSPMSRLFVVKVAKATALVWVSLAFVLLTASL